MLVDHNNVDCVTRAGDEFRILGPGGAWPSLDDASEREAVCEKLQAFQVPVGK